MNILKIIILIFGLVLFTFASDDEFYCKFLEERYRICRTCPSTDGPCTPELDVCQCENYEAYDLNTKEYYGGSDCKNNDFCYVSKLIYYINLYLDRQHLLRFSI